MKRLIFRLSLLLLFISSIKTQSASTISPSYFKLDCNQNTEKKYVNRTFQTSDTISISENRTIEGLAISGIIVQHNSNSFVRVLLTDKDNKEYVILETCRLYNDNDTIILIDFCEDTKTMTDIYPSTIHICINNCTLNISNISLKYTDKNSIMNTQRSIKQKEKWKNEKYEQAQHIVNQINEYNHIHNKLWRAEITDISLQPWELKTNSWD